MSKIAFSLMKYKTGKYDVIDENDNKVRIICTDRNCHGYPIVALTGADQDLPTCYTAGGIPANDVYTRLFLVEPFIMVNGVKVPKPETEALKQGEHYAIVDFSVDSGYSTHCWEGSKEDLTRLGNGVIHKDIYSVIRHSTAILNIEQ